MDQEKVPVVQNNHSRSKQILSVLVAIMIVLLLLFLPIIPISESYSLTEQYEREALYYTKKEQLVRPLFETYYEYSIHVYNNDTFIQGTFTVKFDIYDEKGLFASKSVSKNLTAFSTDLPGLLFSWGTFVVDFDASSNQRNITGKCFVIAPRGIAERTINKTRIIYRSVISLFQPS